MHKNNYVLLIKGFNELFKNGTFIQIFISLSIQIPYFRIQTQNAFYICKQKCFEYTHLGARESNYVFHFHLSSIKNYQS